MDQSLYTSVIQDYKNRENDNIKEIKNLKEKLSFQESKVNSISDSNKQKDVEIGILKEKIKTLEDQKAIIKETKTVYKNLCQDFDISKLMKLSDKLMEYDHRGCRIYGQDGYNIGSIIQKELIKIKNIELEDLNTSLEYLNLDSVKQDLRKELEK